MKKLKQSQKETFKYGLLNARFSPVVGQGDSKSIEAHEKAVTATMVQSKYCKNQCIAEPNLNLIAINRDQSKQRVKSFIALELPANMAPVLRRIVFSARNSLANSSNS